MSELWDAYNADGTKITDKTFFRGESIPKGMFHLICSIIVKHTDGTYLLMQRDSDKTFGGKWELSAGGAVQRGETALQGAVRELKEETGIFCKELKQIDAVAKEEFRAIFSHFLCITNIKKDAVTFQKGETVAYKWITKEELKNLPASLFMSPIERDMVFNLEL